MKKKTAAEVAETEAAGTKAVVKKAGAKGKPKGEVRASGKSKSKPKSEKHPHDGFDFVGKVESLVVKGGPGAEVFEFGLRGRHGSRQVFRLKTSDSFSLNFMAPIVTAAHANEAKIGVRAIADEGETHYVTEVASRPKLGKKG